MSTMISPLALAERLKQGTVTTVIDVRTPAEFQEVHVPQAVNRPLDRLTVQDVRTEQAEGRAVYVICRSGSRARQACQMLEAAGIDSIGWVEGGTLAWEGAGFPVKRGRKVMSLERQVRIAAGGMVFAASVLAILVHPAWAGLSAFVGGGLVFAGVTDTCGMAMLLARMPWNQGPTVSAGTTCSLNRPVAESCSNVRTSKESDSSSKITI